MELQAEFTIEPFEEGNPGRHVEAALEVVRRSHLENEFGPFGTSVTGDHAAVLSAVAELLQAAVDNGATRVSLQINVLDRP